MIATLANIWAFPGRADATHTAPPKPRGLPLFIGDILTARNEDPEFLIRWRMDRAAIDDSST